MKSKTKNNIYIVGERKMPIGWYFWDIFLYYWNGKCLFEVNSHYEKFQATDNPRNGEVFELIEGL